MNFDVLCFFLIAAILPCETAILGGLGVAGAVAAIGSGYHWGKCYVKECCTDRWTRPEDAKKDAFVNLFKERVFGQHLVMKVVPHAVHSHIFDTNPQKALVMSFHGWTGCGKNFVANLISEYVYREGVESEYVHIKIASEHYPNASNVEEYRQQLRDFIKEKTQLCGRSLFVFDEMDKMPAGVTDVLKTYIDHHHKVGGVDYRKNIFIFLNNVGGNQISTVALDNFNAGKARENITTLQMEEILSLTSLKLEGGFRDSELILSGLVDYFIPFLPMEKVHVKQCASAEIERRMQQRKLEDPSIPPLDRTTRKEIVDQATEEIQFYPKGEELFSKTGCKQVSKKVDMYMS